MVELATDAIRNELWLLEYSTPHIRFKFGLYAYPIVIDE